MQQPAFIGADFIEANTCFATLAAAIETTFAANTTLVPPRHHHNFPNPQSTQDSTMLLMPAWNAGEDAGVKTIVVSPENAALGLPAIQGSYVYLDAVTGQVKAIIEAKSLTAKRTAATSALAAKLLSRPDSDTLLMIGTGVLAPNLIKAHAEVRPIRKVFLWGRNIQKAQAIGHSLSDQPFSIEPIASLQSVIAEAAIISTATLSKKPLILGQDLVAGQHLDLVGAYRPDMREADDDVIKRATVFVDTLGAIRESGDIGIPLNKGIINEAQIKADLFSLCSNIHPGRANADEITVFKSIGHAIEDLAAARYYFKKWNDANNL